MHTLGKVDGIEYLDAVIVLLQQPAALDHDTAFRVGNNERNRIVFRLALHKVGLDEKARFAAAGATDDQYILVTRGLRVFWAIIHSQALGLREDDVVLEYRVDIRCNVLMRAPAGAAVLHILAELLGVLAFDVDRQPERGGDQNTNHQISGMEARK